MIWTTENDCGTTCILTRGHSGTNVSLWYVQRGKKSTATDRDAEGTSKPTSCCGWLVMHMPQQGSTTNYILFIQKIPFDPSEGKTTGCARPQNKMFLTPSFCNAWRQAEKSKQ